MSNELFGYSSGAAQAAATANAYQTAGNSPRRSEDLISEMFREDLGVTIEPQALRMFIRHRFDRLSPLAHRIHDGKR